MAAKITLNSNDYYLREGSKVRWSYVQPFQDLIRQREGVLSRQDNQVVTRLLYGWKNGIGWSRQDRETGRGTFGLRDSTWNTLHRHASYGLLNESQTHSGDNDHVRKYQHFNGDFWALFEENDPSTASTGVATRKFTAVDDSWGGGGAVGTGIRAYDMVASKGELVAVVGTLDGAADNIDVYTSSDGASWSSASGTGWNTYDAGTPVGRSTNPFDDDYARLLEDGNTVMVAGWDEDGSGEIEIQYSTDQGTNWTAGASIPSSSGPKAFVRWLDPFSSPPADSPVLIDAHGVYRVDEAGTTSDLIYPLDGDPHNGRFSAVGLDGDLYVSLGSGQVVAIHALGGGSITVREVGPPGDNLVSERQGYVTFMRAVPAPWLIVGYGGHRSGQQASVFAIDYTQKTDPDTGRVYQPWHSIYLESDDDLDVVAVGYATENDNIPRLFFALEGSSSDEMFHILHPFTNPVVGGQEAQFDAVTTSQSASFSHTVGTEDDRAIYVFASVKDASETTPSSVTYGGVALTQIGSTATNGDTSISLWRLVAPATGSNTVAITFATSVDSRAASAISFYGVDQTTPEHNTASNTESTSSPSLDIESSSRDLVVSGLMQDNGATGNSSTPGSGQNERWDSASGFGTHYITGSTERGLGGTTTMSYSLALGADPVSHIGTAIQPVSRLVMKYQSSSTMQFPEDDMGDPHNDATVHEARIEADNLSATNSNEYVEYKYGTNGGDWDATDLGDFLSGDLELVHGSGAGVAAKTLRNELVGHRDGGDTADSVLLKDFEVMATKTQQVLRRLALEIDLNESAKSGTSGIATQEDVLANLETVMKSSTKVACSVGSLPTMYVRVRQPAQWELETYEPGGGGGRSLGLLKGFASVIIEEVLEGSPTS